MTSVEDTRMGRLPDPGNRSEAAYYSGVTFRRFIAWIIDGIFIAILCGFLLPFTAFTAFFFLPAFWLVVGIAYRTLTLAIGSGTLGMKIVGIEMRRDDGTRFDFGLALVHTLLYSLFMAFFLLQIISIILMLTTARGQGLHDHMLKTAAIRRSI